MRFFAAAIFMFIAQTAWGAERLPFENLHFPADSEIIEQRDWQPLLEIARWLKGNPDAVVLIEGHCDERESENYNTMLGDGRAHYVRAKLIEQGASEEQFTPIVSYGETRPVDPRHNEAAWRKNRRTELVLVK